ncbi:MAG: DUF1592 domain-containing protein [Pirellula sp.]|nr:DUF1592 domain-containing protein [Pirellula sp.]
MHTSARTSRLAKLPTQVAWLICVFCNSYNLANSQDSENSHNAAGSEIEFHAAIIPLLKQHCESCHSGEEPEAKFDVTEFYEPAHVAKLLTSWQFLVSRVTIGDMPPAEQSERPSEKEIHKLAEWTKHFRAEQALQGKGDPGLVTMRRLNHAEFNYAIEDLTGHDIRPTSSFPIDPANEAGFDNSAESLTITPALVTKYLDAARFVSEHMLLVPDGIRFAPHPVVTETDRDKYCVQRIVDFYQKQPTKLTDYFVGCWDIEKSGGPLTDVAKRRGLSVKYLDSVYAAMKKGSYDYGPMAVVIERWRSEILPCDEENDAARASRSLSKFIAEYREKLAPVVPSLQGTKGLHEGSQTVVLWRNREVAKLRQSCRSDIFKLIDEQTADQDSVENKGNESNSSILLERDRAHLADHLEQIKTSYEKFCELFPDAFMIVERGRHYANEGNIESKGRLLSAGFHSMMGYFRDDQPLCNLILDDAGNEELNKLWRELELIALTPIRQYAGFIWFERAESSFIREPQFHFVRAEDKDANSEDMIRRFGEVFLEKIRSGKPSPQLIDAVEYHFADMNRQIRSLEKELAENEPKQLDALMLFASKAFRRSLTHEEERSLRGFYESSRQLPSADHRSAMEDTLAAILVSPNFLYRWDLKTTGDVRVPLTDLELASRLSFFLWGSGPDEQLMESVRKGNLSERETLRKHTQRMLNDERSKRMIQEFLGNWLDFRRFESHNGVDRERFTSFDDEIRTEMAREPIETFWNLLQRDGSLDELIKSDHVVVNPTLAKYYGMKWPGDVLDKNRWMRLDGATKANRSGMLTMGVFLTQNSPGLRTSPVKRGYWVVRKLLGEKIPPPPPNVPELPDSEHDTGDLTLREVLARHREHPSCAACHNRFDAAGLLLEGFDPIGRPRDTDLAGRTISSAATMPEGSEAEGWAGLRDYIVTTRMDEFRRNFCENLVAYALGRTLVVSDDLLVEEMMEQLAQNNNRVRAALEHLIESPQFLNKRGSR